MIPPKKIVARHHSLPCLSDFSPFPATTNVACSSHWEKKLVIPVLKKKKKKKKIVLNSGIVRATKNFPVMKLAYLQLFNVYHASIKILKLLNTLDTFAVTDASSVC